MTTPTKWVSPHRQGAMELNPDMVQKIDDEIWFELDTMPDTEIVRHWMFSDVSYRKALADLIVVDGDPLADLSLLARPQSSLKAVIRDGQFVLDRLRAQARDANGTH